MGDTKGEKGRGNVYIRVFTQDRLPPPEKRARRRRKEDQRLAASPCWPSSNETKLCVLGFTIVSKIASNHSVYAHSFSLLLIPKSRRSCADVYQTLLPKRNAPPKHNKHTHTTPPTFFTQSCFRPPPNKTCSTCFLEKSSWNRADSVFILPTNPTQASPPPTTISKGREAEEGMRARVMMKR